jgi:hypothetical protein
MRFSMLPLFLGSATLVEAEQKVLHSAARVEDQCPARQQYSQKTSCNDERIADIISRIELPDKTHASVSKAQPINEDGTYTEPGNYAYSTLFPETAIRLPKLCAVTIQVNKSDEGDGYSSYRLGIFLPEMWNHRSLVVGGGAFSGGIAWSEMAQGPHYGFATISTDTGHYGDPLNQSFAASPGMAHDWGHRAMHGSVLLGKQLIKKYYNHPATERMYSYYTGCSTGGRQGLKEIQVDANSFDGALIGAPAWDTKRYMPWVSKVAKALLENIPFLVQPESKTMLAQHLQLLAQEVMDQCDGQDGLKDHVISDPEHCTFNIHKLRCTDQTLPLLSCLSDSEISVISKSLYGDYLLPNTTATEALVGHGFDLGSEVQWPSFFFEKGKMEQGDFNYERFFMGKGADWSYKNYNDSVAEESIQTDPGHATADAFDLSAFKARRGRILMYHGMADGMIPTKGSQEFYNRTLRTMGESPDTPGDWFRYFEVPGLQHCSSGAFMSAPWYFAGAGQAANMLGLPYTTGFLPSQGLGYSVADHVCDPQYDALMAVVRWVEENRTVDAITATAYGLSPSMTWFESSTKPICPYPRMAKKSAARPERASGAQGWVCD